jgi:hypothetical protein
VTGIPRLCSPPKYVTIIQNTKHLSNAFVLLQPIWCDKHFVV